MFFNILKYDFTITLKFIARSNHRGPHKLRIAIGAPKQFGGTTLWYLVYLLKVGIRDNKKVNKKNKYLNIFIF